MPVKQEDLQTRVTIESMMRFEERAQVEVFQLVARAIEERQAADPDATVDMYEAIKPTLQSTKRMACFVYECCFTKEMREATSFDDFVKETQWMELAQLFDFAYLALFTFSQDQSQEKSLSRRDMKARAKAEVQAPPA